jgi:hypothetical protein
LKSDGVLAYLLQWKKRPLVVLLALVGLVCLLFGGLRLGSRDEKPSASGETDDEAYRLMLEERLVALLCEIDGVGAPEVFVTLERGEENRYSGSKLLSSEPPRVLGVAVVCRGGGKSELRSELTQLISALFGIGAHRIHISEKSS